MVATGADTINQALGSQISYWQGYNANLQALGERTSDIEGLSDLIASFADGSAESVNVLAGMAQASDEDLAAMVKNWQGLQQAQSEASEAIAGVAVDLAGQMDEFQRALAGDIEAMDLGDEAKEAGRATIQGYLDAASDMLPDVKSAYSDLAYVARRALAGGAYSGSYFDIPGHAAGTENAAPGLAMVGENGPELVMFNGGEKVLNAVQTSALQSRAQPALSAALAPSGGSSISISVNIPVNGNATPVVLDSLREYGDKLAETVTERVMDALEEERIDAIRRAY